MEERIVDDDESRVIKLKRTKEGGTDAVDALAEGEEGEETEEIYLDLPEEEYDEDLVGLTPTQLKEELERRERAAREAHEESERLRTSADEKLAEEKFADAELLYEQALVCDGGNEAAAKGLWTARTKNFTDEEALFAENAAGQLAENEAARAFVVEKIGKTLKTLRDSYANEEAEIAPGFEQKQEERREAFAANRKYYLLRFSVFFVLAALFLVGVGVSASFILRTKSDAPIILIGVFAGLAVAMLAVAFVYARKLFVASRLYAANEKLSSTETGARIEFLRGRLHALEVILTPAQQAEENGAEEPEAEASGAEE